LALVGDAIDVSDTYVQCDAQKWEDPVCPSRVSGVDPDGEVRFRNSPTLMGLGRLFEAFADPRSRYSVHGSRRAV
jgi:hypothetical protein